MGGEYIENTVSKINATKLIAKNISIQKTIMQGQNKALQVSANVDLANYTDNSQSAVIVLAVYEGKKLIEIGTVTTYNIPSGTEKNESISISNLENSKDYVYKVFVYENFTNMRPLTKNAVVKANDYKLEVFKEVINPNSNRPNNDFRVMIISDTHMNAFDGVGGYTWQERMQYMVDAIIAEYNTPESFDFVIFAGDLVNNDSSLIKQPPVDLFPQFKETYLAQLEQAGIRYYLIHASHDFYTTKQWTSLFGYGKNYIIEIGDTSFVCADTFGDTNTVVPNSGYGASDIPDEFLRDVKKAIEDKENVFIVSHWPSSYENFKELTALDNVIANIAGHTHYNSVVSYQGKPLAQTGYFSRSDTRLYEQGQGFKAFVPTSNLSECGNPWGYRIVERKNNVIDTYMIFAEMEYKQFTTDSITWEAFYQPYATSRNTEHNSFAILKYID